MQHLFSIKAICHAHLTLTWRVIHESSSQAELTQKIALLRLRKIEERPANSRNKLRKNLSKYLAMFVNDPPDLCIDLIYAIVVRIFADFENGVKAALTRTLTLRVCHL